MLVKQFSTHAIFLLKKMNESKNFNMALEKVSLG